VNAVRVASVVLSVVARTDAELLYGDPRRPFEMVDIEVMGWAQWVPRIASDTHR
jgi:hypothetical protein